MKLQTSMYPITLLRTMYAGLALATSCVHEAQAFGSADSIDPAPLQQEFSQLDGNLDKKLSREEAARDKDLTAEGFRKADLNKDGWLSADEYASFKGPLQQKRMEVFIDDSTVPAKVKAEIIKDTGMKGLNIRVETYKGGVILSGFVENGAQQRRAVEIASGVRGVHFVKNALVVKS